MVVVVVVVVVVVIVMGARGGSSLAQKRVVRASARLVSLRLGLVSLRF